jgi:AAA ATPase domain
VLIGRESECARLDELLDRARTGRSGALLISGEAGIGKTALLDYAVEHAEGMTVVRTLGVESEAELEFSGLLEVCRPLLGHLAELPEHHAEALRAALDLGPAVNVDRFAVGVATLGLLAAAAEAEPLLVLVDDSQWLDASSADALLFATRRLEAEGVAVVYAARDGGDSPFEAAGVASLSLTGLPRAAATGLLRSQAAVTPEVADRLYEETGGNPLALLELPRVLKGLACRRGFLLERVGPDPGRTLLAGTRHFVPRACRGCRPHQAG